MIEKLLYDMDEASSLLGLKKSTLYQMVMRKEINVVKAGKLNKFRRIDLDNFICRNLQEAKTVG
ncbi:MAG: helix-turn-helix domain-containing protein [Planctomycetes bacterium]|nr:helix-turn-helix domain-containing protein [Planctomycetota bacterium]